MSGGRSEDSERFADVVSLGTRVATPADPRLRRDLEVVALLRRCATDLGPDRQTSDRMRTRLMAELVPVGQTLPRLGQTLPHLRSQVVGSRGQVAGPRERGAVGSSTAPRRRTGRHRSGVPAGVRTSRLVVGSAAAACLVLSLAAANVLLSRDALPGDTLYGVKRAAESMELGLTFGQEAKARRQLEFAAERLDEVEALVGRLPAGAGSTAALPAGLDAELIARTLQAFDDEAAAGARLLLPMAAAGSGPALGVVGSWAEQQSQRLSAVLGTLPASAKPQAHSSLTLLTRVASRAAALSQRLPCERVTSGTADDLGPLPATGRCVTRQSADLAGPVLGSGSPLSLPPSPSVLEPGRNGGSVLPSGHPELPGLGNPGNGGSLIDPRFPSVDRSSSGPAPRMTVPLPVPGMPPVNLPPLIPGMPGITVS